MHKKLVAAALALWLWPSYAAPAPWYWWTSRLDTNQRVCAQFMPSQGWERGQQAFSNPRCTAAQHTPQR